MPATAAKSDTNSLSSPRAPGAPPLVPAAIGLCAGILIDDAATPPGWVWVLIGLAAAAVLLTWRPGARTASALMVLIGIGVGGASHFVRIRRVAPDHVVHVTTDEPIIARLTATIVSEPTVAAADRGPFASWSHSPMRTTFVCRAEWLSATDGVLRVTGEVRVTVREPLLWPRMGDRVELTGRLFRPMPPRNPGEFDWARWNARNGLLVGLSCPNAACVWRAQAAPAGGAYRWWGRLRARVRGLLFDSAVAARSPEASLLEALILGQRQGVDPALDEAFVRAGCAHYLAASGFNVGVLASVVWFAGRALRRTRRACAAWAIAATILYVLAADPRPPILRAGVMTCSVCVALAARRSGGPLTGLVLSAVLILLFQPAALFDAGFQLSFVAVLSLLVLAPPVAACIRFGLLRERPPDPLAVPSAWSTGWPRRAARWLRFAAIYSLAASIAAWLGTLPITLIHFQQFSPWGSLNSFVLTLLVSAVTIVGYFRLLATALLPTAGTLISIPLELLTAVLARLVRSMAVLPGASVSCPPPPVWLIVVYAVTLVALTARYHGRCGNRCVWAAAGMLALCMAGWLGWPSSSDRLTITAFSVGRASATTIELPDGRTVLFDCGGERGDVGDALVASYLLDRRHTGIDALIISHPNLDHFNGVPSAVDRLSCRRVVVTNHFTELSPPGCPAEALLMALSSRRLKIETVASPGRLDGYGDVQFDVLWPPADPPFDLSANDSSLVIRMRYAGCSILFTGDVEEAVQRWLIDHADISADVLFAPHHGAVEPSTEAFIRAVGPRWVIQSSGEPIGHGRAELRAVAGDRTLLNTADDGAVTIDVDHAGIRVSTFRGR